MSVRLTGESIPRRPRLSAAARRESIMDAARAVFAERGYERASTAEIAARAGCSEPLLYRHFASKQALFVALLRDPSSRVAERVRAAAEAGADPRDALRGLARGMAENPVVAQQFSIRAMAASQAHDPEIGAALRDGLDAVRGAVADVLALGQRRGVVTAAASADDLSWLWFGMTLTVKFRQSLEGGDVLAAAPGLAEAFLSIVSPAAEVHA
jgi:AcrR family transcriptional regulator